MGSSFKANKSQNLINTKLIPACEFDAYFFKIMFHFLGTEGLIFSSFCHQVLHKSDFFLVVGSPGSIKRIFVIAAEIVSVFSFWNTLFPEALEDSWESTCV